MCDTRALTVKGTIHDPSNGNISYSLVSILGSFRREMTSASVFNLPLTQAAWTLKL